VVAANEDDGNFGVGQAAHLFAKEEAGLKIFPVAVVDVAGDQHQFDLLFQCEGDQVFECAARRQTDLLHGGAFVTL
jgi:hypothetical protein